jgi:hypothetical protein
VHKEWRVAHHRKWLVGAIILAGGFAHSAAAEQPAPPSARVAELVQQLKSDQHAARERAVLELAVVGPESVPSLVTTAASKDLESAWRALETLQILSRSADVATAKKVHTELSGLSRSADKAEAGIAQRLLREWPALRHNYAVGQLELLGAEIAEIPAEQMIPMQPAAVPAVGPGPAIPFGGFFGGLLPGLGGMDGPAPVVEAIEVVEAEVIPADDIERLVEVGDPAPKAGGFKLVEKLIRALGGAAKPDADIERLPDEIIVEPEEVIVEPFLPEIADPGLEPVGPAIAVPDVAEPGAAIEEDAVEPDADEARAEEPAKAKADAKPEAADEKPADVEDAAAGVEKLAKPAEAPAPDTDEPVSETKPEAPQTEEAKPADVEFIEEAPAGGVPIAMDAVEGFIGIGGRMMFRGGGMMMGGWSVPYQPAEPVDTETLQPGMMRLGKEWRGGDTGLEFASELQQVHTLILNDAPITDATLSKLRGMNSLSQLKVNGTRLTSAGLLKFHQQRPNVNITAVGPAALGVSGTDHQQGFQIQAVAPETGARRAGLDEQDIITKVAGFKVRGLSDITLALYDKQVGTTIQVEYVRGGKRKTVVVTLTEREAAPTPVASVPQYQHQIDLGGIDPLAAPAFIERFIAE